MYTSFSEVTAALSKKLHDLKYSDGTIQKYEREWTRFENYLSKNNIEQYDMETVKDYFFSKYNVLFDATAKEHSRSMRQTMRALRTLIDFKNHGVIYRRVSGKDHSIPSGFQEPVHDFLSKAEETLASSSCRQYRTHVECFVSFLHEQGICNFSELTPEIIKSFWKTRESLSKQTKEYDAYVLRKLLDFLYESKTCAVDLSVFVPKVKGNHKGSIPSFYTVEELTKLLSMVDRFNPTGKRDYAILLMAIRYGMRVGDIRNLKLSDFDWENDKFSFIQSKTGKRQEFHLLPEVSTALIDYFKNGRPDTECKSVFVRHTAPYTEFGKDNNLHYITRKYMNMANFTDFPHRKCGLHSLRHSIAGNMLDQGIALPTISEVLGHSSTETTMIYTKISIEQLSACGLEV